MIDEAIEERQKVLGVPSEIDPDQYANLIELYDDVISKYRDRDAFTSLGRTLTYGELDDYANAFCAYLQNNTSLEVGDRIAIQLPNIIQYPVAVVGAIRAGLIVVNTNPLYTERELEHQFNDSGAKALLTVANVAHTAEKVISKTSVKHVIVTELADLHPSPKRQILNFLIKYLKRMVPAYNIEGAASFFDAIEQGKGKDVTRANPDGEDVAILQYTGGTTGVAKGAMLTHRNIIANTLQSAAIFDTYGLEDNGGTTIQPLPLYHIYAVIVSYIFMLKGGHTVLIPNPRDVSGLVKELKKWKFQGFCGLNTLFVTLCNDQGFRNLDFSELKMTLSGGMALTQYAAKEWEKVTGCEIYEGYGLTETSPVVSVNTGNGNKIGTIGIPVPSTEIDIRDAKGNSVDEFGEAGELWVKGPQVMKGYWEREDATNEVLQDGWLASGDMAMLDEEGYLKIVDRKKDMIIVSGFNVYPNEVENVITSHEAVLECAVIGVADDKAGEKVQAYIVKSNPSLTVEEITEFCKENLAAYKVPREVIFKDDLPKSNVGKILRREIREANS